MNTSVFETDVQAARQKLTAEKQRGFWTRLLTFGIVGNRDGIVAAECELTRCRGELLQYQCLLKESDQIDEVLGATDALPGVRVGKHTFADVPVELAGKYGIDWEQLRETILSRDGHECQEADGYCAGPLQIHHIRSLSRGGTNSPDNLVTLCLYHHSAKHPHVRMN